MKVNYDQEVCIHAGECVGNLPSVFSVENGEFKIDQSGASDQKIRDTVSKCPSGALTIDE